MDNESKMTVIAKDGKALIGNHFHELSDESALAFTTDDLGAFKKYLTDDNLQSEGRMGSMSIYYSGSCISAISDEININTIPTAVCTLAETNYIQQLRNINSQALSVEQVEKIMILFRPFSGAQGKQVLDFCKSAHIEAVINIDREKNNSGDYQFSVMRKKSGKDRFTCPESVSFKVPIFKNISEDRAMTFETSFDYETVGDAVKMTFTFSNIDFGNVVEFSKREILEDLLKDLTFKKYWGTANVRGMTDAWKYKSNPLTAH